MTQGKAETRAAREARLRAALRENLKRRKAQVRGRARPDSPNERQTSAGTERLDDEKHS